MQTVRTQKAIDVEDFIDSGKIVLVAFAPVRRQVARTGPDVGFSGADHEEVVVLLSEQFGRVAADIDEPERLGWRRCHGSRR